MMACEVEVFHIRAGSQEWAWQAEEAMEVQRASSRSTSTWVARIWRPSNVFASTMVCAVWVSEADETRETVAWAARIIANFAMLGWTRGRGFETSLSVYSVEWDRTRRCHCALRGFG